MNTIHQISLKLQMGIHPAADVQPEILRAMWRELLRERAEMLQAKASKPQDAPATTRPSSLFRAG